MVVQTGPRVLLFNAQIKLYKIHSLLFILSYAKHAHHLIFRLMFQNCRWVLCLCMSCISFTNWCRHYHYSACHGQLCLLMLQDVSASCAVEISGNNIAGRLTLQEFSAYLKWSKIGKLHIRLIQVNQNISSINFFSLLPCMHSIQNCMKLNRWIRISVLIVRWFTIIDRSVKSSLFSVSTLLALSEPSGMPWLWQTLRIQQAYTFRCKKF